MAVAVVVAIVVVVVVVVVVAVIVIVIVIVIVVTHFPRVRMVGSQIRCILSLYSLYGFLLGRKDVTLNTFHCSLRPVLLAIH